MQADCSEWVKSRTIIDPATVVEAWTKYGSRATYERSSSESALIEALGIDMGGVIISRTGDADTSFFKSDYLETPPVDGAFDMIMCLSIERFEERVFLVSKRDPRIQEKTIEWLKHHRFFERTGLSSAQVHFCLERSEKAHPFGGVSS